MRTSQAHEGCLKILKYQPSNADVLEQLRLIYLEMNEPARARVLFQDAFDYCKANNPTGPDRESSGNAEFGLLQIIALTDFYNNAGDYRTAVNIVRQGARWLDGRLSEGDMWDGLTDDREFDVEGVTRDGYTPSQVHPLDVNLRQRLAVSRLRLGELIEAEVIYLSPNGVKAILLTMLTRCTHQSFCPRTCASTTCFLLTWLIRTSNSECTTRPCVYISNLEPTKRYHSHPVSLAITYYSMQS